MVPQCYVSLTMVSRNMVKRVVSLSYFCFVLLLLAVCGLTMTFDALAEENRN